MSLETLKTSPYNLVLYDNINVKVISVNVYGESIESSIGTGAFIQYVPDSPVGL